MYKIYNKTSDYLTDKRTQDAYLPKCSMGGLDTFDNELQALQICNILNTDTDYQFIVLKKVGEELLDVSGNKY